MQQEKYGLKTWLDRDEAARAIRQLSEDDLLYLNAQIIDRLKLINQAHNTVSLARFSVGDRVQFNGPNGKTFEGVVTKLNQKTAGVQGQDGRQWKVSPGLLTHLP